MKYKTFVAAIVAAVVGAAAHAQDWAGAYAGITLGAATSDQSVSVNGGGSVSLNATATGVALGYQMQTGSLVYGAELAYAKASFAPDGVIHVSDTDLTYTDIKARLGYAMGNVLVYGTAGWSYTDLLFTGPGITASTDGALLGLGVDYAVGPNLVLGAEYVSRDLSGSLEFGGNTVTVSDTGGVFNIKATYRF